MRTVKDLAWTAGFLEGEGWFGHKGNDRVGYPRISASQVQQEPLIRLQMLFGGSINWHERLEQKNGLWTWAICGTRAAEVMMTLYTLMSPRRQMKIKECLLAWIPKPPSPKDRTHCPKKHEYTPENTYFSRGGTSRLCKTCNRENARRYKAVKQLELTT